MSNALQVFSYNGNNVRTVERNGDIWFVAKDFLNTVIREWLYKILMMMKRV